MIKELNAGDEIQVVNPTGQATDAASYIELQQRLVAAGQGISYEATSRDMSKSNYSSTRQGIIEDDMTYAEERSCCWRSWTRFMKASSFPSGSPGRLKRRISGRTKTKTRDLVLDHRSKEVD